MENFLDKSEVVYPDINARPGCRICLHCIQKMPMESEHNDGSDGGDDGDGDNNSNRRDDQGLNIWTL